MKRFFAIVFVLLLCASASADNGKIYTRKNLLSDFPDKIMKVVLSGNDTLDMALRAEMIARWFFSPYEVCTKDEFATLRNDNGYYFLIPEDRGGITFLTLCKGGNKSTGDRSKKPFEVITLPAACSSDVAATMVYMPAFVDIIQAYIIGATQSEAKAYSGFKTAGGFDGKLICLDPADAAGHFTAGTENALCGFVLHPLHPGIGDKCYKVLISADTHEIYYLKSHTISAKSPAGWLDKDLSRIYDGN